MPVPCPDYCLVTNFRYDAKLLTAPFNTEVNGIELPYLLFVYHVERLLASAAQFDWPRAVQTMKVRGAAERLRDLCDQKVMECGLPEKEKGLGMRVLLSWTGDLKVEAHPIRSLSCRDPIRAAYFNPSVPPPASSHLIPSPIFTIVLDTQPTPPSLFTAHKTTFRVHYDAARARWGIRDRLEPRDVLLYNDRGELTECSTRNVAFWRDGGWVTPAERCGGLCGTVRRFLLERGLVREGIIRVGDLRPGEWILLSNGWDGTLLGRLVME